MFISSLLYGYEWSEQGGGRCEADYDYYHRFYSCLNDTLCLVLSLVFVCMLRLFLACGRVVVKALRCKPESSGFETL
jgi:hypothetical protein